MKKLFTLIVLLITATIAYSQSSDIWTPFQQAVYQRSTTSSGTGGSTVVTFSGQVWSRTNVTYRIQNLNKYGVVTGDWKAWQSLPAGAMSILGNGGIYHFTLDVPTGWYIFEVDDHSEPSRWEKFGVGEVFIIAGQSNAQGANDVHYISGVENLDCVVGNRNAYTLMEGDLWTPTFTAISPTAPNIAPRGDRPWYYQLLGNKIATREAGRVVPVAFYNAAHGGSSIDNWYESMNRVRQMFNNNYGNLLNIGTPVMTQNPWGFSSFDNRLPYFDLKNLLSYYVNMTGVRAVLWHQGEAETKTLLSIHQSTLYNDGPINSNFSIGAYDTKLNAIIADTRTIHPNLQWAISKVSLMAETRKNTTNLDINIYNNNNQLVSPLQTTLVGNSVIQEQTAVQSGSPSNVSWLSQNSDSYTSRQADGTHFNETSLTQMANETYSNMTTILSKTAILPIVLPRLNLVKNGTYDYTASTSTTYSIYRWKNGLGGHPFEQDEANMGNNYNPNPGSSGDPGFSGFVKGSDGKISQIVPWVYINSVPGARLGVESTVDELTLESTKVFPNPLSKDNKLNVSFSTTMETPMKIRILDQNGLILKEMSDVLSIGKHNYSIALDDLHLNSEINFIYYKLETKQHNEIKRVLLTK